MWKKVANIAPKDIADRSEQLGALQDRVHDTMISAGLADANCRTVCEERLVLVNGQLQREVVCHTVCDA